MHNLELHEDGQWEITEILEDHTYKRPHCVAELFLNPTHQMDSRMISLTEIKAVLRLMRNRMELRRYAHHSSFPVGGLLLSLLLNLVLTLFQLGVVALADGLGPDVVVCQLWGGRRCEMQAGENHSGASRWEKVDDSVSAAGELG
jgi:hypothetical protein